MTTTLLKQPFHEHLDECEQCRNNPMALCQQGHNLLINRNYDVEAKPETVWCFTCQSIKPKDQVEAREVTNVDGKKSNIARCIPCWNRRAK